MPEPVRSVLFLCTQNACRSQMAELWAKTLYGDRLRVASAGTQPAVPHPRMLEVMKEAGVQVWEARSKHLDEVADEDWDLVVTLCDAAAEACPTLPGAGRVEHHPFADPAQVEDSEEEVLEAFREIRAAIRAFVADLQVAE
jgi:arsenate reductase